MLRFTTGDMLSAKTANVEALVNTVNSDGGLDNELAVQLKKAFPENFKEYRKACSNGDLQLGIIHVHNTGFSNNPKYIFNFPIKDHWFEKPHRSDIKYGLKALVKLIKDLNVKSIAIPPLGCGLRGLKWNKVKFLILKAFKDMDMDVLIFEPYEVYYTVDKY